MCFCVLLYFTACMLYYCNMVGRAWRDWGLIWWLTILLQCFDTVGWVTWPVKISSPNDLYCVEWDTKPYSTQLNHRFKRKIQNTPKCAISSEKHFFMGEIDLSSQTLSSVVRVSPLTSYSPPSSWNPPLHPPDFQADLRQCCCWTFYVYFILFFFENDNLHLSTMLPKTSFWFINLVHIHSYFKH